MIIMKTILFLLVFLVATGCGKTIYTKKYSVDEEAKPYLASFVSHLKASGKSWVLDDLEIHLTGNNISDGQYGYCTKEVITTIKGPDKVVRKTPRIYLHKEKWKLLSYAEREQLVFHELGHCILGLDHNSASSNNRPVSVMYPTLPIISPYYDSTPEIYTSYMQQLFNYKTSLATISFSDTHYSETNSLWEPELEISRLENQPLPETCFHRQSVLNNKE